MFPMRYFTDIDFFPLRVRCKNVVLSEVEPETRVWQTSDVFVPHHILDLHSVSLLFLCPWTSNKEHKYSSSLLLLLARTLKLEAH